MSIDLNIMIGNKLKGIISPDITNDLIISGGIDILEKIKEYKSDDLQKFIIEQNITNISDEMIPWTAFNATGMSAWAIMGVKRSTTLVPYTLRDMYTPKNWKTANKLNVIDKHNYSDPDSLKFITGDYPGFIVETNSSQELDGDNDDLAVWHSEDDYINNYIVTVFPKINVNITQAYAHAWKIQYIPIPTILQNSISTDFHVSYYPALAVYVAKNIVLNEMNRLLLAEEDLELATELKNHYALLEQEYANLMNIPPKKETK